MKIDSEPFRKYITQIINDSGIVEYKPMSTFSKFIMFLLCYILIGFIWLIVESHKKKEYKKQIGAILPSADDLYQKYFDLCVKPNNKDIEYEGFCKNNILENSGEGLSFVINNEHYEYDVHEWTEIRTREVYNSETHQYDTEYYTVYFYEDATKTYIDSAKDLNEIDLNNNYKRKNKTGYQTESMDFNNRFIAKGNNELQLVKLLRPIVIDNFISDPSYHLPGEIKIDKGNVSEFSSSGESLVDWDMSIVTNSESFAGTGDTANRATNKIEKDFSNAFSMLDVIEKLKL